MTDLKELHNIEELDKAISDSRERPVLLFKHSRTCPISARAFREFESFLERADPRISYTLVTVQTARTVSDEAASRLGIRHESPQAIIVKGGQGVWNASHFDITATALEDAIRKHS
jgi:bacillithiol system protein YtxJ